jgi:hypothetical protein
VAAKKRASRTRKGKAESTTDNTTTNSTDDGANQSKEDTSMAQENGKYEVKFVDELPKIARNVDSGVWVERLQPLRDNPGKWAQIYATEPGKSPHAQVNNLKGGNAAGINPDDYEFKGRSVATGETDEDGKPVKQGLVFARLLTDEQKAERDQKRAEREAKKAEKANA